MPGQDGPKSSVYQILQVGNQNWEESGTRERAVSMRPRRRDNSGKPPLLKSHQGDLIKLAAKGPPKVSKLTSLFDRKPGSLQVRSLDHVTS